MDELIAGGYDEEFRVRLLKAATKGFSRMWEQERLGESRINRPEASTRKARRWGKLCGKTSWFKTTKRREPNLKMDKLNVALGEVAPIYKR